MMKHNNKNKNLTGFLIGAHPPSFVCSHSPSSRGGSQAPCCSQVEPKRSGEVCGDLTWVDEEGHSQGGLVLGERVAFGGLREGSARLFYPPCSLTKQWEALKTAMSRQGSRVSLALECLPFYVHTSILLINGLIVNLQGLTRASGSTPCKIWSPSPGSLYSKEDQ